MSRSSPPERNRPTNWRRHDARAQTDSNLSLGTRPRRLLAHPSGTRAAESPRANLVELVADGPAGHFEGLSLRLYNPESRQWSLNFAGGNSGAMSPPVIGAFKNGRGEFYGQETFNGRAIFVRFVISDITPDSCRFEQAFSDDGGKTWEVNWIAVDTRVKEP